MFINKYVIKGFWMVVSLLGYELNIGVFSECILNVEIKY